VRSGRTVDANDDPTIRLHIPNLSVLQDRGGICHDASLSDRIPIW
jgi:hypothetical protein